MISAQWGHFFIPSAVEVFFKHIECIKAIGNRNHPYNHHRIISCPFSPAIKAGINPTNIATIRKMIIESMIALNINLFLKGVNYAR